MLHTIRALSGGLLIISLLAGAGQAGAADYTPGKLHD